MYIYIYTYVYAHIYIYICIYIYIYTVTSDRLIPPSRPSSHGRSLVAGPIAPLRLLRLAPYFLAG